MPSYRQKLSPIIVDMTPGARTFPSSTIASPGSPKAVHFSPRTSGVVTAVSRPLSQIEAWSLYHFETHARRCTTCFDPLDVYKKGGWLCDIGHGLAQDVAMHVYHRDGEVYSTAREHHKHVRVEVPHGYDQLRSLLQSMALGIRNRAPPVVSQDRSYYVATRTPEERPARVEAMIQPATTTTTTAKSRGARHKSTKYRAIVVDDDVESTAARVSPRVADEWRSSVYVKELPSQERQGYRVEIREPERQERRERRRTGFWS